MSKSRDRIVSAIFCLYCAAMICLLFVRSEVADVFPYWEQVRSRTSLAPFHTIRKQCIRLLHPERIRLFRHSLVNLVGNIFLFLPLGIFLPWLFPKLNHFWKVMLTAAGIVLAIEITQVLTLLGRCDIDDLILNLAGTAIGYGVYKWLWAKPRN